MHKARLLLRPLRRGRSAELSCYESADPSTELPRFPGIFRLRQHAYDGLGPGGADEDPARAVELSIDLLDLREQLVGQVLRGNSHVLFCLWITRQYRRRLGQAAAFECSAEEHRGGEPVAGDVILEIDDVAGLLAAKEAALSAEGLEHVTVTDVGREQADPSLLGESVEAEVRHLRHRHDVDVEVIGEDREDLIAIDRSAVGVDGKHAVAVSVESDAEVEVPL